MPLQSIMPLQGTAPPSGTLPSQSTWVILLVAGIPAFASIVAAVVAGMFAARTRRSDADAQRARDLETRISDRKYDVYKPMINYLRVLTQKGATTEQVDAAEKFTDFSTWIGIYGSDGAVKAFHNLMQAAYQNPPPAILLRLYGDFMVEARKDMGYPDTTVQYEHLLGMKINNIYESSNLTDLSFETICHRLNWQPPWQSHSMVSREPK